MTELLSGYDKSTQALMFRVYAEPLPGTGRRLKHKDAHFAALDLLGAALAEDFGVTHAVIRRKGLGKPHLIHDFLHINLSHCKGLAVAAVGRMPLGVDAEAPRTVRDPLLEKVCTVEEIAQIRAADDGSRMFARFWTLKEAYAKYTGKGIALDFTQLGFALSDAGTVTFRHPESSQVCFFQLPVTADVTVSLCIRKERALQIFCPAADSFLTSEP